MLLKQNDIFIINIREQINRSFFSKVILKILKK